MSSMMLELCHLFYALWLFVLPAMPCYNATVSRVIDGDTFYAVLPWGRERVRLIGIDTPERAEEGYMRARKFLEAVEGKPVLLCTDLQKRDSHGRLLGYAIFNGQLINSEIERKGFGKELVIWPNCGYLALKYIVGKGFLGPGR